MLRPITSPAVSLSLSLLALGLVVGGWVLVRPPEEADRARSARSAGGSHPVAASEAAGE